MFLTRTAWMTASWEGKSQWPGLVVGKIRSLWSNTQGSTSDGLNQLIDASDTKLPGRDLFYIVFFFFFLTIVCVLWLTCRA